MLVLNNSGNKLSLEEINNIQKKFSIHLPIDYQQFLLNNNGGYVQGFLCTPNFIMIDSNTNKHFTQTSNIDKFYSLEEAWDIWYDITIDDPIVNDYFFPIAYDSSGNYFLIRTDRSNENGSVYFADHEMVDTKTGYLSISKIADSFTNFVNSLHPFEE